MSFASHFKPHEDLVRSRLQLLPDVFEDASHDLSHVLRVWKNVQTLMANEGGDRLVLIGATVLHDCVEVPKDSPLRASSSRMAAEKSTELLTRIGCDRGKVQMVAHAIEAHSFSANILPTTLEDKILQDADRLDAIGHIGTARCFYVSGRLGRGLCDIENPDASRRELDDTKYAVDHFFTKLLKIAGPFQTETGKRLGAERHKTTRDFLKGLLSEVSPQAHGYEHLDDANRPAN